MSIVLNRTVRLRVGAAAAKPGPAIGQALGPLGLNMADFCKQFNDRTKTLEKDIPCPVVLSGKFYRSPRENYLVSRMHFLFPSHIYTCN